MKLVTKRPTIVGKRFRPFLLSRFSIRRYVDLDRTEKLDDKVYDCFLTVLHHYMFGEQTVGISVKTYSLTLEEYLHFRHLFKVKPEYTLRRTRHISEKWCLKNKIDIRVE